MGVRGSPGQNMVAEGKTSLTSIPVPHGSGEPLPRIERPCGTSEFVVKAKLELAEGGVRVFVPKAAPFNTTVTLSATPSGTLGSEVVTVQAGHVYSDLVTVDTSSGPVTVSVESVRWTGGWTAPDMETGKGDPITID